MTTTLLPPSGEITRAVLLGVLAIRPMHGYEVKKTLAEWRMDFWADIKTGSIYASLKRLEQDGFTVATGTGRDGNRPVRTTYTITAKGRDELARLLREFWLPTARLARPVDIAFLFLRDLSRTELIGLLEQRLQGLANQQLVFRPEFVPLVEDPGTKAIVEDLFDHERRMLEADRDWAQDVLERLRAGVYERAGGGGRARRSRARSGG